MKRKLLIILSLALYFFAFSPSYAEEDQWQCVSMDYSEKKWIGFAAFQRAARQKALDSCKKNSVYPKSCILVKASCLSPFSYKGKPDGLWVCTALDRNGSPWKSDGKIDRIASALAARAYCRAKSSIPYTCYINTVTCTLRQRGL